MKKYFILMTAFLVGACASSVNKTEFVNPIFNQPLRPLSSTVGYTYITPASIDRRTPKDKNLVDGSGECELVENTQERITLKCNYKMIPQKGLLEDARKQLNNTNPIKREIAQTTIRIHSTTYEKYFTYYIEELFFDTCLVIKEDITNAGENHASSTSSYCVTPPDNYNLKSY